MNNARTPSHGVRSGRARLLVDISVIARHDAGTGIQRVVRAVWSQLSELDTPGVEVLPVFADRRRGYCFAQRSFLHDGPGRKPMPVTVQPGDEFLGLDLAAHFLPYYAAQLSQWRAGGATLNFVVYDLLPVRRPDWFASSTVRNFERWLAAVTNFADRVFCISDTVAEEFRNRIIGTEHERIEVKRLYLSGDVRRSLPSAGITPSVQSALDQLRSRPFVLMVGTIEPRKAHALALEAFEHLWAKEPTLAPSLLVIGKPGWKTEALQRRIRGHREFGRRLHWLDDVSDEALTQFYELSTAVLIASYDEGFGLPAIEAATHRRWALVRELPVFLEQELPNLRFFADDSAEGLSRDIIALVRRAKAGSPEPACSPTWSWCVERLIGDLEWAGQRDDGLPQPARHSAI